MKKMYTALFFSFVSLTAFASDDNGLVINSRVAAVVDSVTVNHDAVTLKQEEHKNQHIAAKNTGDSIAPSAPDPHDPDYWKSHSNYDQLPASNTIQANVDTTSLSPDAVATLQGMVAAWSKPAAPPKMPSLEELQSNELGSTSRGEREGKATYSATGLPGDVWYATLMLGADSYVNGPVMAKIQSGYYKGATVLGQFQIADDGTHLIIAFTQLSTDTKTFPISGFAMPADAKLPALTGKVDHHFFTRFIVPLAVDFVAGAPAMFNTTGEDVIMNDNTTVVTSPKLTTAQKTLYMAGYAADKFSPQLQPSGVRALPEVKIPPGTGFGLVLIEPITE